ncbi:MAG: hypothetical protein LBD02_04125 [Christensenellaceae bacterium]|nr:hypothetical protein [Christensenellaceae bacterium]
MQREGEIRQILVFSGELDEEIQEIPLPECEEGELFYVPAQEVMGKDLTFSMRAALWRYLCAPEGERIVLGVV